MIKASIKTDDQAEP